MGVGKTNKRKGSNAERYYAKFFRELGHEFCGTSRAVSKKHDNAKIDLMYVPFNIQIKAGKQKGMNPGKELFNMFSHIQSMFPKEDEVFKKPLLLFHYKERPIGTRNRTPDLEMVYMSQQQFEIFQKLNPNFRYDYIKTFKFELQSEFKTIVGMTLETFKNEIILKHYCNGTDNNTTTGD